MTNTTPHTFRRPPRRSRTRRRALTGTAMVESVIVLMAFVPVALYMFYYFDAGRLSLKAMARARQNAMTLALDNRPETMQATCSQSGAALPVPALPIKGGNTVIGIGAGAATPYFLNTMPSSAAGDPYFTTTEHLPFSGHTVEIRHAVSMPCRADAENDAVAYLRKPGQGSLSSIQGLGRSTWGYP